MRKSLRISILIVLPILISLIIFLPSKETERDDDQLPNDWFFSQRAYPVGKINYDVYLQSLKQTQAMRQSTAKDKTWEFAGPVNVCGRLSDVESHPDITDIYLGTASGGIFRIQDDGSGLEAIFDDALSLSIGDIAIAPSDPQIIYVGTGEANCGGGSQTYDGTGIYRSNDGGESWESLGLEESRNVGRIAVHPQNPDTAYVAAMGSLFADTPDRGIYRTFDGGSSWEQVLYVSDSTGGIDIIINPDEPEILYAAMWERIRRPNRRNYGGSTCGIYKTTDGGDSWTELTNGLPSPSEDVGRIGIDLCKAEPDVLYAIYADDIGYFKGVYKSMDAGLNWTQTNDGALENSYVSYGWWFGRIAADPVDPDIAYVIGFDLYKTSNGGSYWSNISEYEAHVDQHALYIDPLDNDRIFLGNDGGYYTSDDGGSNWDWIDILPVTQFYTCEIDEQFPQRLYGGTQDNGTNRTQTGNTDDWDHIYGGDGFYVLVNPENNNYVYAEYQYGGLGRSTNGGYDFNNATNGISSSDRKNWNTPVVFDPSDPQTLYYGSNRMYRSTNHAASWSSISTDLTNGPGVNLTYGTITTISVSPANTEIIYCGTDDGNVWVSLNNGASWEEINTGLPDRWVTRMAADPIEENTVYITFSGYRWDDYLPHIFKSDDQGENWLDISSNLPEIPLNDIIVDPENNNILYVASDAGVFSSNNTGESWEAMGSNIPLVPVNDLDLHNGTRKLVAATFGRSMYSYDLNQDTVSTGIRNNSLSQEFFSLEIYPNPVGSKSRISIKAEKASTAEIYLVDMNGKQVGRSLELNLQPGENQLLFEQMAVKNCQRGIYTLILNTSQGKQSKKIIWEG